MRTTRGKYETGIRLGVLIIVVLLMLLNISTTYVLHRLKYRLTADIDTRLGAGLRYTSLYLTKNQTDQFPDDQLALVRQRQGLSGVIIRPLSGIDIGTMPVSIAGIDGLPGLNRSDLERLQEGEELFRASKPGGRRLGLAAVQSGPGQWSLIVAATDSLVLDRITSAARVTFYLAVLILLLIIPMTIGLPRFILRPFKKMRDTARSAGRFDESGDGDDVSAVIESYKNVIGELKRKEAELTRLYRESSNKANRLEKLNQYILRSIGSGVINVDLAGRVIGYNRAAENILGYDVDYIIGRHYLVAFPDDLELGLMIEAGLERGEITGRRELEIIRDGNTRQWLAVESSLIHDDNDHIVGVTLLIGDMTEMKTLQAELETSRRMAALGEMTGGLAHQLRNSLAAVSGFAQLLQRKVEAESELGDIAASIRSEAATSEAMVRRFLDFARPLSLVDEPIDLNETLGQCVTKFADDAAARGIELRLITAANGVVLTGDRLLLKETFANLIDNALEAVDRDGRIEVSLSPTDSGVRVSVADNGPGIPESIKKELFTPFVSSKPSGTGLGLALTYKIVTLHRGTITVESSPDSGTVFRIDLPHREARVPVHGEEILAEAKKV